MDLSTTLHPTWKIIASDIIPPFSQEIITKYLFVYCINRFFHENEHYHYRHKRKQEQHALILIVKIRAYCQIPLTPTRKTLIKEAINYFEKFMRRNKTRNFVKYIIRLIDSEPELDPQIETSLLAPALSSLVQQAARQGWSKMKFYQTLLNAHSDISYKLNSRLSSAVDSTLQTSINATSLASVTKSLIDNYRSQKLSRTPRTLAFTCVSGGRCDRV